MVGCATHHSRASQWRSTCTLLKSTREGSGVVTHDIGKEEVGIANIKVDKWPTSWTGVPSRLLCPASMLQRRCSDARCVGGTFFDTPRRCIISHAVRTNRHRRARWETPHSRDCWYKRLAPAIVNDVARVDTATPPSSSSLKNADDPAVWTHWRPFADFCEDSKLVLYEDTLSITQKAFGQPVHHSMNEVLWCGCVCWNLVMF